MLFFSNHHYYRFSGFCHVHTDTFIRVLLRQASTYRFFFLSTKWPFSISCWIFLFVILPHNPFESWRLTWSIIREAIVKFSLNFRCYSDTGFIFRSQAAEILINNFSITSSMVSKFSSIFFVLFRCFHSFLSCDRFYEQLRRFWLTIMFLRWYV